MSENKVACSVCEDQGWYADHSDACYMTGTCQGECPVQRQCDNYAAHIDAISEPEGAPDA